MAAWRSTTEWKTPRLRRRFDSLAKKPSTALSQEQEVGVKWKVKRSMAVEPGAHLGVLVGGVVVEDDVDGLAGRHLGVDGVEEADELLMPVALHVPADDGAVEHVEGGEQRRRAVALVVVGHGAEPALLHGQAGLGAVERLDLALLVDRQHDGMGRRIDIEADDVAQLVGELRVGGELELPPAVGLQPVRLPDAATALALMPTASAIMSAVQCVVSPGGSVQRQRHHALGHFGGRGAECARAASCRAAAPRSLPWRSAPASATRRSSTCRFGA